LQDCFIFIVHNPYKFRSCMLAILRELNLVDVCIVYGNLSQITGRLYTYTVYNVIRIC